MIISLSTWKHGFHPNHVTYDALVAGHVALDAVELGAKYCEADLTCMSVGCGGIPDSIGQISLDASIMDHNGRCGSVAFVRNYQNVASLARRVMEKTNYIMLVGEGAEMFAEAEGFIKTNLLTERAEALYKEWSKHPNKLQVRLRRAAEGEHEYVFVKTDEEGHKTEIDPDRMPLGEGSHDTIGIIAMDSNGHLAGTCTTSGLAFKLHGRVGDSPIIGGGLYVDGEIAAAVATGDGELMMRSCTSFHIVEMIRQGIEPGEACERAIQRIAHDKLLRDDMQAGVMVIRSDGAWAGRSLRPGFQLSAASDSDNGINRLYDVTERTITAAPL